MLLLLLAAIDWWHWLVLAMILVIIEIVAPSFYFLWIASAAAVMTLVTLVFPGLDWETQLLLFGAISIATLLVQSLILRHVRPAPSDQPLLNRRGEQYGGRTLTLLEPIENGYGVVRVDDTRWKVIGPTLPAGAAVRVVGTEGMTLRVEAMPPEPQAGRETTRAGSDADRSGEDGDGDGGERDG